MSIALEVQNLCKQFGRTRALEQVSFQIEEGDSVALLGPNGAGKTTLMRLCATLLRPTRGRVELFGQDVADGGAAARSRIGLLSHESFLYPDLTATENLVFHARLFRVSRIADRVAELIERMDLEGWAHRPLRFLSRGAQQRCALARVLLHNPDLLFLDEPFTGLDIDAAAVLHSVLADLRKEGTTIVMSTHNLARSFESCSSTIILKRGRLIWQGPLDSSDAQAFEERYRSLLSR